jgi:hypothetical protein
MRLTQSGRQGRLKNWNGLKSWELFEGFGRLDNRKTLQNIKIYCCVKDKIICMSIRTLVLVASFSSIVATTMVLPQTLIHMNNKESSSEKKQPVQQAAITLNAANLKKPHILKVSSLTDSIEGQIKLNGKLVELLGDRHTWIELSSVLQKGKNVIEIAANYRPAKSTVTVELTGPNTQVSQQTGGSGKINQVILIDVR